MVRPATRVLVTGGSGFIAGHCILRLLDQGYEVRTTVRSLGKEAAVRSVLADAGMGDGGRLSFVAADLLSDAGWSDAVAVDYFLHVASPVHPGQVDNEDDLIVPAREGTLRVLRAASWGHPHDGHVFTENDWTVLDGPGVDAYGKSKTLAERAAWEYIAHETGGLELATMLPVAVMGPVLGRDVSGANHVIQRILTGGMAAFPTWHFHRRRQGRGGRPPQSDDRAGRGRPAVPPLERPRGLDDRDRRAIRANLGDAAAKVPTRTVPNVVVRLGAVFNQEFRPFVPDLGYSKKTSNERARRVLSWTPRDSRQAIVAAAQSMAGAVVVA